MALRLRNHLIELIEYFKIKEGNWWDYIELGGNPNFTWEVVDEMIYNYSGDREDLGAFFDEIVNAPYMTLDIIKKILDSRDVCYDEIIEFISPDRLSKNPNITMDFIRNFEYRHDIHDGWNFELVCGYAKITLADVLAEENENFIVDYCLFRNPNFSFNDLMHIFRKVVLPNIKDASPSEKKDVMHWCLDDAASNRNLTWSNIKQLIKEAAGAIDKTESEFEKYLEVYGCESAIVPNCNIIFDDPDTPTHFYEAIFDSDMEHSHPCITKEVVKRYPDVKWDCVYICGNPNFTYEDLCEYYSKGRPRELLREHVLTEEKRLVKKERHMQFCTHLYNPKFSEEQCINDYIIRFYLANPNITSEQIIKWYENPRLKHLIFLEVISQNLFGQHPYLQKKYKEEGWLGAVSQGRQVARIRFDKSVLLEMYTLLLANQRLCHEEKSYLPVELVHMIGEWVMYTSC